MNKAKVDYTITREEIWERLLILKDGRTHRKRVPTEAKASLLVDGVYYEIPLAITSEGGVLMSMTAANTAWLEAGVYDWDLVATVSRSALLTSTPLSKEKIAYGKLTVVDNDSITPLCPVPSPLARVDYTPCADASASAAASAGWYVTNAELDARGFATAPSAGSFITDEELDSRNYVTAASAGSFITDEQLEERLAQIDHSTYATNDSVTTLLLDYVTTAELDSRNYVTAASAGSFVTDVELTSTLTPYAQLTDLKKASGYEFTAGFADRTTGTAGATDIGSDIEYTPQMVADKRWYRFGFSPTAQITNDQPYWTNPTPASSDGIGLFGGLHMPLNTTTLFDFSYSDTDYSSVTSFNSGDLQVTAANGSFDFRQVEAGSLILVRFDFNATPTVSNTNLEVAMIWSTRDPDDNITFTFPLTHQPVVFGSSTAGITTLCRPMLSAYMASSEDVNARALLAVRSDQPIFIQPLTTLVTVIT